MENQSNFGFKDMPQQPKVRSTLLTVFLIFSFVGAGFGILGGLAGLVLKPMLEGMPGMEAMKALTTPLILVGLLAAGVKLYGAIQMWKLKRTGFFLYTAGELASAVVGAISSLRSMAVVSDEEFMGGLYSSTGMDEMTSMITMIGLVFNLICTTAFIIVYATQLKHMD